MPSSGPYGQFKYTVDKSIKIQKQVRAKNKVAFNKKKNDGLTKTAPLGPALLTVAPNHCSDFWSIC